MRISIAMACFNGAQFLEEQLSSLASQSVLPFELVACDDGSEDDTVKILKAFQARAPFPVHVVRQEKRLGYGDNFLSAVSLCQGDWIAFCDQDDIWFSQKLADAAAAIERHADATLILQRAQLCNAALEELEPFFPQHVRPGYYRANAQYGFWVWPGFLQTVKREVLELATSAEPPRGYLPGVPRLSHDRLTCMIGNALGGVCVLGRTAASYRRHDSAWGGSLQRRSLGEFLKDARQTGQQHYEWFGQVAAEAADFLREVAGDSASAAIASALQQSARGFDRLADVRRSRARLYRETSWPRRMRTYSRLWMMGGYLGPTFSALGLRSAVKDGVVAVFGSSAT